MSEVDLKMIYQEIRDVRNEVRDVRAEVRNHRIETHTGNADLRREQIKQGTELREEQIKQGKEVSALKVKAGMWGGLSGIITALLALFGWKGMP